MGNQKKGKALKECRKCQGEFRPISKYGCVCEPCKIKVLKEKSKPRGRIIPYYLRY